MNQASNQIIEEAATSAAVRAGLIASGQHVRCAFRDDAVFFKSATLRVKRIVGHEDRGTLSVKILLSAEMLAEPVKFLADFISTEFVSAAKILILN